MASTITAGNATNGLGISSDNTGILALKSGTGAGTTALTANASQVITTANDLEVTSNLKFNSGYGSAATAYGCRAWVNFNGTGTVAIRASGNCSSVTDNGVGNYTVNFSTAMPDVNFSASLYSDGASGSGQMQLVSQTTTTIRVGTGDRTYSALVDGINNYVSIFR